MNLYKTRRWIFVGVAALVLPGGAFAASIIDNGTVQLGVDDYGQLNIPGSAPSPADGETVVGLRYLPTGNESTSHGCLCEGWGAGIGETGDSGKANNDQGGATNLSFVSFSSDATSATSVVDVGTKLRVTHAFAPAAETANLYRVSVSIENTSGVAITDLRYTRTFDWDIEPDTFDEYVTHQGTATTTTLLASQNNGFVDSDVFGSRSPIGDAGAITDVDFVDAGNFDHGSNFDFGFGALAAGDTFEFDIFYGAADTEVDALAALSAVSVELFSLGQASSDPLGLGLDNLDGNPTNTFMFGFSGVGGDVILPAVPVPAAIWLFGTVIIGFFGGGKALRRRQAQA